ncbi:MAG: ATP-binding protein [Bacteroidaceae bacterium]
MKQQTLHSIMEKKKNKAAYGLHEAILSTLPIGIELYDKNGICTFANAADVQLFGLENRKNQTNGTVNLYSNPFLEQNQKEQIKQGLDVVFRCHVHPSQHAESRDIECRVRAVRNDAGEMEQYVLVAIDVTNEMNCHRKLASRIRVHELVLNNDVSGVVILNNDYRVEWEDVEHVFGDIAKGIYTKGSLCYHCFGLSEPCSGCPISQSMKTNQKEVFERYIRRLNMYFTVVAIPILEHGVRNGTIIRISDITKQKNTTRALKEALSRAEESDRLKSAFLANMSHEIRTPLNAIVGFSSLLVESTEQHEKEGYCRIIEENNERLLCLIGDILDLSKMESGLAKLVRDKVSVKGIMEEVFQQFCSSMPNDQVQLLTEFPENEDTIIADKKRLMQVMSHFLTNAIKHTSKGSITIGYTLEADLVKLWVKDTGIGISENNKSRVFGRFEKFDDFAQGTGLGLSICKAIAVAENGDIGFSSTLGTGSTFWIAYKLAIRNKAKRYVH